MNTSSSHETPFIRLGVTGGVGSGKSYVCDRLKQLGVFILSLDALAREAVMPGTTACARIIEQFGSTVLMADGALDRPKLRAMITTDAEKKKRLEEIVHPEVFDRMREAFVSAKQRGERVIAVEAPLLFETGMASFFDYVLMVTADRQTRVRRIMDRDGVTRDQAEALMAIQLPEDAKIRRSDVVVTNNGRPEETRAQVDAFFKTLMGCVGKAAETGGTAKKYLT